MPAPIGLVNDLLPALGDAVHICKLWSVCSPLSALPDRTQLATKDISYLLITGI